MKLIYIVRQIGEGLAFSYLSIFLIKYGFNEFQSATLLGIIPAIMVVATPLMGLLDDGQKGQKKLLIMCYLCLAILTLLLLVDNMSYLPMAIILFVSAIFRSPVWPSSDSLATIVAINNNKQFSQIRVCASATYIFIISGGGLLVDYIGFDAIFIISAAAFVICAIISLRVPIQNINNPDQSTTKSGNYKQLLKNRDFIVFTIITILIHSIFSASFNFDAMYFLGRFNNSTYFGLIDGFRVVFEVLIICIMPKLKKQLSTKNVYIFFGLAVILRSLVYYFLLPIYMIVISAAIIGTAFGLVVYTNIKYISQIVKKHNLNIAISIYVSAQMLFNTLYTYGASAIVHFLPLQNVYLIFAIFPLIGVIVAIFAMSPRIPQNDSICK